MADEDITLDGQPLQSLRVADLKAALEKRNLSKSGAKNKLIQRLKGALMLENLQKSSTSHSGLQPNSQIGEEMSQNSFIQQYLAKQQELLRHRLEREAQLQEEADGITRHKEPPAPSPPRAVASLSVRVLGQPDRQGLPPALSRAQEKEGVAPSETGSAHSVLHLSRSAGVSATVQQDSDEDDDDDDNSGDDEDWGPGPVGARKGNQAPPRPPQMPASSVRSKRKLQPPQHIPPPQPHQNLMQLRHPTPPPSPPPDLFPLPDTPKQSPPDTDDKEGECSGAPPSGPECDNPWVRDSAVLFFSDLTLAHPSPSRAGSKTPPVDADGGAGDADTGAAAGRKRRWGSSTAVTAKKPSISITTDSLKSLIPDIKIAQEAVVDLHPEELQLSGDEDNKDNGQGDEDDGLKIRRTVTQAREPSERQENGRGDEEEDAETAESEIPFPITCLSSLASTDDGLVRRSISQQRSGVSITIDDPIRSTRKPSPPRGKLSNIVHVTNLVRPFTVGQLKELLKQTGSMVEDGFWIDKIKSHCYVTYTTTEEAAATRESLHGVKWPQSNPKVLSVDFCEQDELDFHKGLLKPNHAEPEHERGAPAVRDLWAERQRQMERRERARGEREWDRDKIREFARPGADKGERRSRSRDRDREREKERRRRERPKKKADEPPAKLLDDLFLKTKAAPCIYWLPLTEEQVVQKVLERSERQKERERRLKELQDEQEKVREERKKERLKAREKEDRGGATASSRAADADREKERSRNKDGERRREGERRPGRPPLGRRSRSCSDTRDRRH
uniref:Apoptotic chromatin condensation inducer 1b n=1 Tax=Hippocampus comes TaxID=109280 RepID=A0A3Q2Y5W0_HIPCM